MWCLQDEKKGTLVHQYTLALKRIIVVDYGGTIAQSQDPALALFARRETEKMTAAMRRTLRALSEDPINTVLVVSGSSRRVLARAFKNLPHVSLAAENGFFFKPGKPVLGPGPHTFDSGTEADDDDVYVDEPAADNPQGLELQGWTLLHEHLDVSWLDIAANIMEVYCEVGHPRCMLRSAWVCRHLRGCVEHRRHLPCQEIVGHRVVLRRCGDRVWPQASWRAVRPPPWCAVELRRPRADGQ